MGYNEYVEALKMGKKEYRSSVMKGEYPYLPVLDDIVSEVNIESEVSLGTIQIPLDQVVGTSNAGRTTAFAKNFMPILEWGSEFAAKWAIFADAQVEEGIRDPIKCYEYMNRFYVVEGNKRVSVLKYYDAVTIPAVVTRKIPKRSNDLENKIYFEFLDFHQVTGVYDIWFNYLGGFPKLLELIGGTPGVPFNEDERMDFHSVYLNFKKAFQAKFSKKLNMTEGEALVIFLTIYGYEATKDMLLDDMIANISKSIQEFYVSMEDENIELQMDPVNIDDKKKNLFSYIIPSTAKKLKVAFVYDTDPGKSDWIYAHNLGRNYLQSSFPDQIETSYVSHSNKEEPLDGLLIKLIQEGNDIIFTTSPEMMQASLRVAIEYPDVKILNCSLNNPHGYIRTYYARMYEAKFLAGVIAGSMASNNKIAYVADYPIYGMIANINAFALGANMVNPEAKVYLCWSKLKDSNVDQFLKDNEISYVSDQELIVPQKASRRFGLYHIDEQGNQENYAMPVWNWGIFYEKLIQSILSGSFKSEDKDVTKALNYWWGMSAGVIDLICSAKLPAGTVKLVNLLKQMICDGTLQPFSGVVNAQQGTIKSRQDSEMTPEEIITMDWLTDNVVGSIPAIGEFVDEAQDLVQLQGVSPAVKR